MKPAAYAARASREGMGPVRMILLEPVARLGKDAVMLTLDEIGEIVADIAPSMGFQTQVVGVTTGGHDSAYAEVILTVVECSAEPCRFIVGVDRNLAAGEIRGRIADTLRRHAQLHPPSPPGS